MIRGVQLSSRAKKDIRKAPRHIVDKLDTWIDAVEREGLAETRKIRGYHDERLKGGRQRQRSIRLSRSWRAIYEVRSDSAAELVSIEEVTHHAY